MCGTCLEPRHHVQVLLLECPLNHPILNLFIHNVRWAQCESLRHAHQNSLGHSHQLPSLMMIQQSG